jgi:hypothetical protein
MNVEQKVKSLNNVPKIDLVSEERLFPEIMEFACKAETRDGLWWYDPVTTRFEFSVSAKTHFQLSGFDNKIESTEGWVRGYVVSKDGEGYILIYMCDFISTVMSGEIFNDIYKKIKAVYPKEVFGIVSEEGKSLLG